MFTKRLSTKVLAVMVLVAGLVAGCEPSGVTEQVSPLENTPEQAAPIEDTMETETDAPAGEASDQPIEAAPSGKGELVIETVPAPSLANNLIGEPAEQTVAIYLPPSYQNTDRSFPVVFFLAAVNEPAKNTGLILKTVMDLMLKEGQLEELILVAPNAGNVLGNSSIWVNSPVTGNWEDYIAGDLVSFIDANYRTLATPASRGIAGELVGGFGAYNLAMHHPEVFGSVYAKGPTLFAPDGLEKSWIADTSTRQRMLPLMEEIATLAPEAAHERLLDVAGPSPLGGAVSYAMAFVADVAPESPYFEFEYIYQDDELEAPEEVWQRWASGYGGWDVKTADYEENFASLNSIALSYSELDQPYVREGTQYASEQLQAAGIDHELYLREKTSTIQEMQDLMLPFFSHNLSFE